MFFRKKSSFLFETHAAKQFFFIINNKKEIFGLFCFWFVHTLKKKKKKKSQTQNQQQHLMFEAKEILHVSNVYFFNCHYFENSRFWKRKRKKFFSVFFRQKTNWFLWYRIISFKCNDSSLIRVSNSNHIYTRTHTHTLRDTDTRRDNRHIYVPFFTCF